MALVIIGSCNGLVPEWHQAITWTSDDLALKPSIQLHIKAKFNWIYNRMIYYNWSFRLYLELHAFYPGINELTILIPDWSLPPWSLIHA